MKFLVNYFNFGKKADYYISDNDLEVQYFPDKKFQKGGVRIIPRKEKILLDEVKSKQILEKQIGINDIYFSFKRAKNIIEMNGAVFLLGRDFCEPKQTAIGGYKTENFNFAILKRRINAFVRHNSPKDTKDHELDGKGSTMKPMEKKQELKELFYGCLLALILIE